MFRIPPHTRLALSATLLVSLVAFAPALARAADAKKTAPKEAATKPPKSDPLAIPAGIQIAGLPHYAPPEAFSVDLVMKSEGLDLTMKRSIDHGRIRTDMTTGDQQFTMIELGDEKGTTLVLMPEQKMAMKQTRAGMEEAMKKVKKQAKEEAEAQVAAAPELKIEDLGDEAIEGHTAKKIRFVSDQGPVLGWFDKESGAPMRFESTIEGKKSTIEWKNLKPGPQPAELFEVPKGYEVQDMDEMMKSMGGMSGVGGMGMAMAGGMASGYAQNMGSSMGASLGGTLGASFGGPIGMIAGQYIGGKIGGMVGKKAADVVLPGKQ
jgi:hypothetical protein